MALIIDMGITLNFGGIRRLGRLTIQRLEDLRDPNHPDDETHMYKAEMHKDADKLGGEVKTASVAHRYGDGAWRLVSLALEALGESRSAQLDHPPLAHWFPCDRDCIANGQAVEDCSQHGRTPRQLWDIIDGLNAPSRSSEIAAEQLSSNTDVLAAVAAGAIESGRYGGRMIPLDVDGVRYNPLDLRDGKRVITALVKYLNDQKGQGDV